MKRATGRWVRPDKSLTGVPLICITTDGNMVKGEYNLDGKFIVGRTNGRETSLNPGSILEVWYYNKNEEKKNERHESKAA